MFNLDLKVFYFLYSQCASLGRAFGFGAFEGFVLYSGMIAWGICTVSNAKKGQKK